jgi:hypothetical protein
MAFEVQGFEEIPQVNKIFTDREEPRKAFWDKYKQYKENMESGRNNKITILTYYGIGGIGKSTLLHKLQQEIEEYKGREPTKSKIPYVYYDMKTDTSKRAILEGLRKILIKDYGFTFPVFELALNIYMLKIGKGKVTSEHEGIIAGNEYAGVTTDIATAGIDLLNVLPLAGPIAAGTLKIIDKLIANQRNKNSNRKIELSKLQNDSPEEILQNLQLNFAKDLAENMKDAKYPLIIFLDTYEILINELSSVGEPLMNDNWLRDIKNGLVTHTPNTIWVIAGREIIKWDHLNSEWRENFEQHLVGNLSEIDTKQFLTESGITNSVLQIQIYEITKGTPVYLDICVENYWYLKNNGKEPTKELLGEDEKELLERFLRYADDSQKDIFFLLSCLDEWTENELYSIASRILNSVSITTIKKIKGYSFIESSDGINYRMHQLVKDVLYNYCDLEIRNNISSYIENSIQEKLENTECTSEAYMNLLKQYILNNLRQQDNKHDPLPFYEEIYGKYIKSLKDTFQYDEACNIIEYFIQQANVSNERPLFIAKINMDYAYCLMLAGKYKNICYYAEIAVESCEAIQDEDSLEKIELQYNLSTIYSKVGRNNEALAISEKVLELYKRILGDEHPETIMAMNSLSIRYSDAGRNNEALAISEKVSELYKRILGDEHSNTIMAMDNLSNRYSAAGRNNEALAISEKVLELSKRILGEEHPQ